MGINFLNIHNAVTILQARVSAEGRTSLLEQADRFMRETPYMIVDLGESQLSSMLVGELVNMHNFAREHWGERFPGLYLVGLSPQARSVILLSRLDQIMPIEPNLDAAMNAIEKRRREEKPAAAG